MRTEGDIRNKKRYEDKQKTKENGNDRMKKRVKNESQVTRRS